ncbi:MAG: hypothetical protein QOJ99_118 [Bryobacterales bacterium]|jgi:hypothetical protein|nr:hypothetical protein [Bryobacterales bacterium]
MRHAVLLGFAVISLCSAQSWVLYDICAPDPCHVSSVNHSGSATGFLPTPTGALIPFVYTPQAGFIRLPITGIALGVNEFGDVVGGERNQGYAFVSRPPYTQFVNLSTVFGWNTSEAVSINDYGDIVGTGFPPTYPLFPGLNVVVLEHINNRRQIVGLDQDSYGNLGYFLYTPGTGITPLIGQPVSLSNTGHVLTSDSRGAYILTPGGNIQLPAGYVWAGLNDNDEVVGGRGSSLTSSGGTFLYSQTSGVLEISNSVSNGAGWTLGAGVFLSNNRVISAYAVNPQGQQTQVLLAPATP